LEDILLYFIEKNVFDILEKVKHNEEALKYLFFFIELINYLLVLVLIEVLLPTLLFLAQKLFLM
jgi:hypothetical protein